MRRSILYAQEQGRSYDFLSFEREALYALGIGVSDLLGSAASFAAGLTAAPTGPASLNVTLTAGRIYQLAAVDATQFGTLAQDSVQVFQQGYAGAQTVAFSTAGLAAGQSRWALVQATFTQTDVIPGDDPNGGILNYWNVNNPSNPLVGPGNTGASQSTRRDGVCTATIKYGTVATTGAEVPPAADANNVGLYLVDLAFGQTQITSGQILVAGPSVGVNVPGNYPQAPVLAGLVNSHHSGGAGQAPKIKLASEVQGTLPMGNLPASSAVSGGGVAAVYTYAGNPNGHVAGVQGVAGVSPPDFCVDTSAGTLYVCLTTGNAAAAVWVASGAEIYWGGVSAGTANAQTITAAPAVTALTDGLTISFLPGNTNTGTATLAVSGLAAKTVLRPDGSALVAGDLESGALTTVTYKAGATSFYLDELSPSLLQSQSMNYAADTGSANAYVVTLAPAPLAHTTGMPIRVKIANTNTAASTLNPNGLGTKAIVADVDGSALAGGELAAGMIVTFTYDGTSYRVQTERLQRQFISAQLSMTAGSAVTEQTHGLGAAPAYGAYGAELVCATTDQGYAVSDRIVLPTGQDTTTNRGVGVYANATKLGAVIGSGGISVNPKGGGGANAITLTSWRLVLFARL